MTNAALRTQLQEITDRCASTDHTVEPNIWTQIPLIKRLSEKFPHSIRLVQSLTLRGAPFTCFMHVFGLIDSKEVKYIATRHKDIYPGGEYVSRMVTTGVLNPVNSAPREEDIILYFDQGVPKHAGIVTSGRIISKWGLGHLWEHDIYEVPISYGSETKIYSPVDRQVAIQAFLEYAESKGVRYPATATE